MELYVTIALAAVVVAALLVTRGRARVRLKGPFGSSLGIEEDGLRGVDVRDARAGRDMFLHDDTGRGVRAENIAAAQDLEVRTRRPDPPTPD